MNAQPLPYLSFALGLPTAPSDSEPTWSERKAVLLSQEHRMASRRSIVEQATRGYFHDFHAIKSHGGKTWRAPPTLIKSERALWFPRITGVRLSDKQKTNTISMTRNKVSVVAILNSKISEEHAKSFYQDTVSTFSSHPQFQLVLINLQENPLKSFMVSLFLSSLKQTLPENLHSTYILSSQNLELEKPLLGLHNKHVGYTYLVDQQGKIRWAGSAFAEQQEQSALKTCTAVLLERKAQPSQKKK
ncbi:hypothetical protein BCV70DRAFT_226730 [Testicularia cyperi]|uniref:Uncharacterized protein n=1 Tax=Testicularia cyperi TaxID=1882483 RepID=A0A317XQB3_9BASI|nr:hypothetical protein BCV70DRAFT_226730 [Testicularia cyperi]